MLHAFMDEVAESWTLDREGSMIELMERSEKSVVGVRISGKVTEEDYERILPELERRIAEHGEIDILGVFDGWSGIEPEAVWRDLSFYARHFRNVRRFAVVGDRPWQRPLARIMGPLTGVETKTFEPMDEEDAWDWLFRRAEADRAWTGADAGPRHARKHRKRIHELVADLREDTRKLEDLRAKALFETAAEVLTGLEKAMRHYEGESEPAWKDEPGSPAGGSPSSPAEGEPSSPGEGEPASPGEGEPAAPEEGAPARPGEGGGGSASTYP